MKTPTLMYLQIGFVQQWTTSGTANRFYGQKSYYILWNAKYSYSFKQNI